MYYFYTIYMLIILWYFYTIYILIKLWYFYTISILFTIFLGNKSIYKTIDAEFFQLSSQLMFNNCNAN